MMGGKPILRWLKMWKPFIVRMNEYNVRVTGTQFNVRNYLNESLATTLVEGE
ncbi:MAG: hypothetical protein ACLU4N_08620 [Butyricimonas faecihominis]